MSVSAFNIKMDKSKIIYNKLWLNENIENDNVIVSLTVLLKLVKQQQIYNYFRWETTLDCIHSRTIHK